MNILASPDLTSRKAQIQSFTQLADGWHFGEGISATEAAVDFALKVDRLLWNGNAQEVEVFPGIDGGILSSGYYETHTLEIRCNPSGQVDLLHEISDEIDRELYNISLEAIRDYIEALKWKPGNSFVYSMPNITAHTKDDSRVRLSSHHRQTKGSQYLMFSVLLRIAEGSVHVSTDTTVPLLGSLLFSGDSIRAVSPKIARYPMNPLRAETRVTETSGEWLGGNAGDWCIT